MTTAARSSVRPSRRAVASNVLACVTATTAIFGVQFALSWANSNATPMSEIGRWWVPVAVVAFVLAVAGGLIASLIRPRPLRMLLAIGCFVLAVRGLGRPFEAPDKGVCEHIGTTLTGTVRGDCFTRPMWVATRWFSLAAISVAVFLTTLVPAIRGRAQT